MSVRDRIQRLDHSCSGCTHFGIYKNNPKCYYDFQDESNTKLDSWCAYYYPKQTKDTAYLLKTNKGLCCSQCGYTIRENEAACKICKAIFKEELK